MKILILHGIDDPTRLRRTILGRAFCLPKHVPEHDYTIHALAHDERALAGERFDAILLDTTFLGYRWIRPREYLGDLFERYDFVRRSSAVKIALPQDDYDHSAVLDRWLHEWKVDVVFTPLARFASVLYPLTSGTARIEPALTGYIDPIDRQLLERAARTLSERRIDVGYRARDLPPYFGRVGRLKSDIGRRFVAALAADHGLRLDISTDPADEILGDRWLDFIGNCRSFLGAASGSSILDPEGRVMDAVLDHLAHHPEASFEAIEAACFPGLDGRYQMTALGPRNLECAAAGTCQLLVPDAGLAPFEPGVHFLPIDAAPSDLADVLGCLGDDSRLRAITDAAHDLVSGPAFAIETFAARLQSCLPGGGDGVVPDPPVRALAMAERLIVSELHRREMQHQLTTARGALERSAREVDALRDAVRRRSGVRGALREALRLNAAGARSQTRKAKG